MSQVVVIPYQGTALPTGSTTVSLFSLAANSSGVNAQSLQYGGISKYRLRLRNDKAGTINVSESPDGVTWTVVHSQAVPASSTNDVNRFSYILGGVSWLKIEWVNGGVTQTAFRVIQTLHSQPSDPGMQQEMAARLPGPLSSSGTSASAAATPVSFAFKVQTTHQVFTIPAGWKGRRVDIKVRAPTLNSSNMPASVWLSFATASQEVDRTVFVTGTPPAFTGDAKIGRPIADGETIDRFIDPSWTNFGVEADLNDTEIYIFPSDYPPTDVS